jgi:hypothetical protein
MSGKIGKWSSVSERKSCVCFAGREAVLSVRNEGRLTSQGANSSGERGKVTYVVVIAEGRPVGDRSRVTVVSLCSVVHQKYNKWWFCVPFVTRLVLHYFRVTCD